jgi:hypothetical protein
LKETSEADLSDVLTIEEIKARFESEWVPLEEPKTFESLEVTRGKVLWHSKDRDEVYGRRGSYVPGIRPSSLLEGSRTRWALSHADNRIADGQLPEQGMSAIREITGRRILGSLGQSKA